MTSSLSVVITFLVLAVESAQLLQLHVRTPSLSHVSRAASPPFLCAPADEEAAAPAPAEEAAAEPVDDPKAAAKAEKAALREAIADLEARLPKARGELVEAADAAKDAGENGYMLLAANFERYRQQARSELDSQKGYGKVAAVRSLLPFAESFEALQNSAEADGEEGAPIHKYYGGIYKQLQQLLETWQVTRYEAAPNDTFDLKIHQTAENVVSTEVPAGQVIAPVAPGWKMGEEVVRLAKVTVSSGPPEEAAEAPVKEAPSAEEATE